ncbi:MAG TPA: lysophospholipid acyltransferase family protein [Pseudomonas sp.]|uniref:lysophospholipid acyltransferase family protein n=1 Tax=Pseudomonas sp. TaxID=306 RepID=UPI002C59183E|nr:lysophospholipid acyltransferase family protein [Pseudomonas sp.]HTO19024.1 lysophospholipid acyltransferase family protein [Pseudomonas sp.]
MSDLAVITESATLARRVGVLVGNVLVTAYYCCVILGRAAIGRLRREHIDRYARGWARVLLRMARIDIQVQGRAPDFSDGRRYIILCNHSSHYDIPVSFAHLPGSIRMLAKKELFSIPLFGATLRAGEFPSINRGNRHQAVRDMENARRLMESGIVLWAAPEGTRSADGRLLPFKKGCFHLALDTDAVIVPLAIRGIHQVLPARSWKLNLGMPVEVEIGEPIDASQYSAEQLPGLMADTRARLQAMLDRGVAPAGVVAEEQLTPA